MPDKKFTTHGNEPIEARIVAWVLGEASAFEADELERLCEEHPELAVFKRRIESVHGLVEQAHDRSDDARWKLSNKKRVAIEELIGAEEQAAADLARDQRAGRSGRRALLAIAACLMLTLVVATLTWPIVFERSKSQIMSHAADFNSFIQLEDPFGNTDSPDEGKVQEQSSSPSSSVSKVITSAAAADFSIAVPSMDTAKGPSELSANSLDFGSNSDFGSAFGSGSGQSSGEKGFQSIPTALQKKSLVERKLRAGSDAAVIRRAQTNDEQSSDAFARLDSDRSNLNYYAAPSALSAPSLPPPAMEVDSSSGLQINQRLTEIDDPAVQENLPISERERGKVRITAKTLDSLNREELELNQVLKGQAEEKAIEARPDINDHIESKLASHSVPKETLQAGKRNQIAESLGKTLAKDQKRERPVPTGDEITAAEEPYSTFSLNINDASFRVAQAALARGEMPDPAGIKVEQFYNAVDYGDPAPATGQPVTSKIEQTAHPLIPGRNLVRIAIKTASQGRSQDQPLRLTLLIDQSGSMSREDRRVAMVEALDGLRGLLKEHDQVNLIGFARTPRLIGEAIKGNQGQLGKLVNIEANEGGTNLEEALKLGEQLAQRHHLDGAQNRIVLFTDGAANLGDADPGSLADKIKDLRQKGISFDIAGIVADGLNDELLGEMARHGNGRYYVVGKGEKDRFAEQLAGAFRPAAENVKVQVHFNAERVGRYKLIGFEKERLNQEDFRNDAVDAAEMAAEEAGVAIYQVETLPEGDGEIGEVSVRFRDVASDQMVERSWTIANQIATPAIDQAQPSMQLATLAMFAGEKLRGGPLAEAINFNEMGEVIAQINQHFKGDPKAAEMLEMLEQLK